MDDFDEKDQSLVRYLLNELSKEENEELEDEIAIDPELAERAQVVEMNLIDKYVLKEMNSQETARFEKGFLLFPENRDKVEDARAFHEGLFLPQEEPVIVLPPVPEKARPSWFASIFQMPAPAMAIAALVLIAVVIVGLWKIGWLGPSEVLTNNNTPANVKPPEVANSANDNDNTTRPDKPENVEKATTGNSPNRNSPPGNEIARLDTNTPPVYILITEAGGDVSGDSRGSNNSSENQDVKIRIIKVPRNARRFTLTVNLKPREYFRATLECSVDISNSTYQPVYPEGEGNELKVKAEPISGELPYRVSISVPTNYLREGKLYYFRIAETNSLTPFKVKFSN
jgi:hypothetical protein